MKTEDNTDELTPDAPLSQVVKGSKKAPELLRSIGLNPEQYADKTLRQVCKEKEWSEDELLKWIRRHDIKSPATHDAPLPVETFTQEKDIDEICCWLEKNTLADISSTIAPLRQRFRYVRDGKADDTPGSWLKEASRDLEGLLSKLENYISFESETFYPLAIDIQKKREKLLDGNVQKLKRSVKIVEDDHAALKRQMNRIEKNGDGFQISDEAGSDMRILCEQLKKLFMDVEAHISIEHGRLLPKIDDMLAV